MLEAEGKELSAVLAFLAAVGVANVGMGYLCQIIATSSMFFFPRIRLVDFDRLVRVFGIPPDPRIDKKALREELLAEMHIRLHSHAPQSLIDHCSRRNSAWYIAFSSAVASPLGWFLAFLVMWSHTGSLASLRDQMCTAQGLGFGFAFVLFVILFPSLLIYQGWRWNREFWEVCWKWLHWDLATHPISDDWWRSNQTTSQPGGAANQGMHPTAQKPGGG